MSKLSATFVFTKREFIVVVIISAIFVAVVYAKRIKWKDQSIPDEVVYAEKRDNLYLIDINKANWDELALLAKIGEKKAKAIIKYRDENGGFKTIDELSNVFGIGTVTVKGIAQQVGFIKD